MMNQYDPNQLPYAQYNPPIPTPTPKRRRWNWKLIAILIGAFLLCGVCGNVFMKTPANSTPSKVDGPAVATDTPTNTPVPTATTDTSIPTSTPAPTAAPPKWVTTHTFTGSGNKKTGLIDVPDDWKIKWTCNQGDIAAQYGQYNLMLDVDNSDSSPMDLGAVNELCKSGNVSGETEEHQAGSVYLAITSEAGWTITIQEFQ